MEREAAVPRPLCWRDWSRQGGWCGPAGCPPARLKQRAHLPRTLHPAAPRAEPRRPPAGAPPGSALRPAEPAGQEPWGPESPGAGGHGPGSAGAGARTRRGAPGTSPALPAAPLQRARQGPGVTGQAGLSWCPWRAPPRLLGPRAPCPVEAWNPPAACTHAGAALVLGGLQVVLGGSKVLPSSSPRFVLVEGDPKSARRPGPAGPFLSPKARWAPSPPRGSPLPSSLSPDDGVAFQATITPPEAGNCTLVSSKPAVSRTELAEFESETHFLMVPTLPPHCPPSHRQQRATSPVTTHAVPWHPVAPGTSVPPYLRGCWQQQGRGSACRGGGGWARGRRRAPPWRGELWSVCERPPRSALCTGCCPLPHSHRFLPQGTAPCQEAHGALGTMAHQAW